MMKNAERESFLAVTQVLPTPKIETASEARKVLSGEVCDWLQVFTDLSVAGVLVPEMLCQDLVSLIQASVDVLDGGEAIAEGPPQYSYFAEVSVALKDLLEKVPDLENIEGDGPAAWLDAGTIPMLSRLVRAQMKNLETEHKATLKESKQRTERMIAAHSSRRGSKGERKCPA